MSLSRRAALGAGLVTLFAAGCGRRGRARDGHGATRVASATLQSDGVLWQLGEEARAKVVAVSSLVDDPRYSAVVGQWPEALPRIPGKAEPILAAAPDLVFLSTFTPPETTAMLEASGLRVVSLAATGRFDDYRRDVRAISEAVGLASAGASLIERFDARLSRARVRGRSRRPELLLLDDGSTLGRESSFEDVCGLVDATNLAPRLGIGAFGELAAEAIVAADPEWIVIPCEPAGCDEAASRLAERPGFDALSAIEAGRVVSIPRAIVYAVDERQLEVAERIARAIDGGAGP